MMSRGRAAMLLGTSRFSSPARLYSSLIELIRIALDDMDCIPRAFTEARTKPIAEIVGGKNRFTVYDLDCPLGTRRNAESATVTFFLIDLNDFSFHSLYLLFPGWL